MAFKVITPVQHNLKDYFPGDVIRFKDEESDARDTLLDLGVIGEFDVQPSAVLDDEDSGDLAKLTVAQLKGLAAVLELTLDAKANKAEIIAAIEAKRAEMQASADPAQNDGGQGNDADQQQS